MADSHAMRNEIVSARITSLPKTVGDPLPEVWASFQDGGKKNVSRVSRPTPEIPHRKRRHQCMQ